MKDVKCTDPAQHQIRIDLNVDKKSVRKQYTDSCSLSKSQA